MANKTSKKISKKTKDKRGRGVGGAWEPKMDTRRYSSCQA